MHVLKKTHYDFCTLGKTWNESRSYCKAEGGDLVSIETEKELDIIISDIRNYDKQRWHIGLVRENGSWTWVSGTPLTFFKLGDHSIGRRNRGMLVKNQSCNFADQVPSGNDVPTLPYICEISKGKKILHLYISLWKERSVRKVSPRHRLDSYVQVLMLTACLRPDVSCVSQTWRKFTLVYW